MKLNDDLLNKFNSIEDLPVSEEMLCAYEEGTLSESEMAMVRDEIESNSALLDLIEEDGGISPFSEDEYADSDINNIIDSLDLNALLDFADTHFFENRENFLEDNDRNPTESVSYINKTDTQTVDQDRLLNTSKNGNNQKNYVDYGYEPNHQHTTFDPNIYQGDRPSCAIRSQEIIMRDFGISISQDELIKFAEENGWYSSDPINGGTPRYATGNLLDAVGIETNRYENASIFDIISELAAGHRIIVSVDANELWIKKEKNLFKRLFGEANNKINDTIQELAGIQGANHALIVAGVHVNPADPSDMKVVLIDSGTGDVCIEYSFKDFQNAWEDSHCHMVTTVEPAPYQYNYHTHQMEPSNFATDFIPSMAVLPENLANNFELPESFFLDYSTIEPAFDGSCFIPTSSVSFDENENSHSCKEFQDSGEDDSEYTDDSDSLDVEHESHHNFSESDIDDVSDYYSDDDSDCDLDDDSDSDTQEDLFVSDDIGD